MERTALMDSMRDPGRLKRNFDFSNTPSVDLSFDALTAFSSTGKNT